MTGEPDIVLHHFYVFIHFEIPKPQHSKAQGFQNSLSFLILDFSTFMTVTVQLDDQFGSGTVEVRNVIQKRLLSAKAIARESSSTESAPDDDFSRTLIPTKSSSRFNQWFPITTVTLWLRHKHLRKQPLTRLFATLQSTSPSRGEVGKTTTTLSQQRFQNCLLGM